MNRLEMISMNNLTINTMIVCELYGDYLHLRVFMRAYPNLKTVIEPRHVISNNVAFWQV